MVADLLGTAVIIDEAQNMEDAVCGFRKAAVTLTQKFENNHTEW